MIFGNCSCPFATYTFNSKEPQDFAGELTVLKYCPDNFEMNPLWKAKCNGPILSFTKF